MKLENIIKLEKHYHHWITLRDAQYLRGMNNHELNDVLEVAREEFFGPGYSPDLWCGSCLAEFIKSTYTQYDKIKHATNPI